MRLAVLVVSAVSALAKTGSGFAQATLPDDAVNSANNPGSVRNEAPIREKALDCTAASRRRVRTPLARSCLATRTVRPTRIALPGRAGRTSIVPAARRSRTRPGL